MLECHYPPSAEKQLNLLEEQHGWTAIATAIHRATMRSENKSFAQSVMPNHIVFNYNHVGTVGSAGLAPRSSTPGKICIPFSRRLLIYLLTALLLIALFVDQLSARERYWSQM